MPRSDCRRATRSVSFSRVSLMSARGSLVCAGCGCLNEQDEFAADAIAGGEVLADVRDCAAEEFFVELGEFAGGHDAQRGSEDGFKIGERVDDAVWRFVEDEGLRGFAGLGGECLEAGAACAGLFRQKSKEQKFAGGQAGGDERAERGVGAGNGEDGYSGGDGFTW